MAGSRPDDEDWQALDDNDPALLDKAVGPVRRIKDAPVPPRAPRPRPRPRQFEADEQAAIATSHTPQADDLAAGDASLYRRPELPLRAFKRLRRGLYTVQDEIDLHQAGVELAGELLRAFLREARERGLRCVRIVHGKGLRSAGGRAVLRPWVEGHLRQRNDVLAFSSAPAQQGGTGALLVLLSDPA
ncbi:Smr/MutS family protein [Pseudomarimonas salicorniae]|uniref:Smr/MutS family protein n=1 Tax=Pseudomarimonas salicorniae TaxID=2933270 RepID=A0ABT0GHI4_9GAMM|nr:Smr/MutS family protein [Lysobacter sp. CAU 1642]MCK7593807.1 Smr/MutS family protein [Lysobacter sp. CAU 1642]